MPDTSPPSQQDLENAGEDLNTLDQFANAAADVNGTGEHQTRTGGPTKVLAKYAAELQAEVDAAAAARADLESKSVEINDIVAALAPGGVLDEVHSSLDTLNILTGYLAPVAYAAADGANVNDARYTVSYDDGGGVQIYAILPERLPYVVPTVFVPADWYLPKVVDANALDALSQTIAAMQLQIDRLSVIHPPVPPVISPIPDQGVEENVTAAVIDLSTYVTDEDTLPENITLSLSGLPAGFTFDGAVLSADNPAVTAATTVTLTATDESGQSVDRDFVLEVYVIGGTPPTFPPTFGTLPNLTRVHSAEIPARDLKGDVLDPDTTDADLVFTIVGDPTHGVEVTANGILGGRAGPPGTYTVTVRATDPDGNFGDASFTLTTTATTPPLWQTISARLALQGSSALSIDLAEFVGDPVTPDAELAVTANITGLPPGGVANGLLLTLPTGQTGVYRISATVTNRAGMSASKSFDFTVFELGDFGGAGGPGRYDLF